VNNQTLRFGADQQRFGQVAGADLRKRASPLFTETGRKTVWC
jgi:hypothetical protein